MQCQEPEYSRPGGRWMDCRRQPHRGEPSGSERVQPQTRSVYLILDVPEAGKLRDGLLQAGPEGARRAGGSEPNESTGVTRFFAAPTLVKML